jgi:hypothetical protein
MAPEDKWMMGDRVSTAGRTKLPSVSSFVRREANLGTDIVEELYDLLRISLYLLVNA